MLVTGATGLVGDAVARHVVADGHEVVRVWATSRPEPLDGARDVQADLSDPAAVDGVPADVDAVVHAAARIPAGEWTDARAGAANRQADDHLVEHLTEAGFGGRWVQLSSVAAVDPAARAASRYATEKAVTEDRVRQAFPDRARSLRISSPYGPGMRHANVLRRFAEAAARGRPITLMGSGHRTQDFVHADDVARAALAAIQAPPGEPIVIASGRPVSMAELARTLVLLAGSSSPIEYSGQDDPQDAFRADYDLDPASRELGWAPAVPLETGLRSVLQAL